MCWPTEDKSTSRNVGSSDITCSSFFSTISSSLTITKHVYKGIHYVSEFVSTNFWSILAKEFNPDQFKGSSSRNGLPTLWPSDRAALLNLGYGFLTAESGGHI